jgi:hypothetical protein
MGPRVTDPDQIAKIEALCREAGWPTGEAARMPEGAEKGDRNMRENMRVGISEAAFLAAVLALAKANGWRTAHFRPGMNRRGKWETAVQGDGVGFPDIIAVRATRLLVAELKVGKNRPTDSQAAWLAAFQIAGVDAYTWWPKDLDKIREVLG